MFEIALKLIEISPVKNENGHFSYWNGVHELCKGKEVEKIEFYPSYIELIFRYHHGIQLEKNQFRKNLIEKPKETNGNCLIYIVADPFSESQIPSNELKLNGYSRIEYSLKPFPNTQSIFSVSVFSKYKF